jgi:glycosyltransferase involved in cell wall biosynthesis
MTAAREPELSLVIPTFNNVDVLRKNIDCWRRNAGGVAVELLVIEDGCRDRTPEYLDEVAATEWGRAHLRWFHQHDLHELRCTNVGLARARAPIVMAWQDDMFVRAPWFAREIVDTFAAYADLGLLCMSRGFDCRPVPEPIQSWADLVDDRRLHGTLGPTPMNWFLLQEVDSVIRPWAVRRACLDAAGLLDEAFAPTEWDEGDLCFRIRDAGWRVAAHGYERAGAYEHLGSTTTGELSDAYKARVLRNGLLFHERWDGAIERGAARARRTWPRRMSAGGAWWTARRVMRALVSPRGAGRWRRTA